MSEPTATVPTRRWPRRLFWLTLTIVALPLIAIVIGLYSSTATRYALSAVANRIEGLTLGGVSGTLADELALRDLRYANDSIDVRISQLDVRWAPASLLRGQLLVHRVAATGIRATPNPDAPATPPSNFTVPILTAPLPLVVEQLSLTDAQWTPLPDWPLEAAQASLAWRGTVISVSDLALTTPAVKLNGKAQIDFGDGTAVQAALTWHYPEQTLNGALSVSGSLASATVSHQLGGKFALNSNGNVALLNRREPYIEMQHTCPEPCEVNGVRIRQGKLNHAGTPSYSQIVLSTQVSTEQIELRRVQGDLKWVDGTLNILALSATGDALEAVVRGAVDPGGAPLFSLEGDVARVDAKLLGASVEGNVAGSFNATGDSLESARATLSNLKGTINGYALSGSAQLERSGDQISVDNAALRLGDNTLSFTGKMARDGLNLKTRASLNALEQIDPRLSGSLRAKADIGGTVQSPQVRATGEALALSFDDLSLASGEFTLNVNQQRQVNGRLKALDIKQAEQVLGAVELQLGGSLDALKVNATLQATQVSANLAATVLPEDAVTVVRIDSAEINAGELNRWLLQEAFALRASADSLTVEPHEWRSNASFLRVNELQQERGDLAVGAELGALPLALASAWLPADVSVAGTVEAQVDVQRRDGTWRGDINWEQAGTVLKLRTETGSRRLALPTVSLQMRQASEGATATLDVLGDFGLELAAKVTAANPQALTGSQIDGQVRANMQDVSWLTPWLAGVSNLEGSLSAEADIQGRADAPEISGSVKFEDGAMAYDAAGLTLEQMTLIARARDSSVLSLEGSANSGGGSLRFEGSINDLMTQQRSATVKITGEDVQAFNAADYQLWLSPDLTLEATGQGASVSGKLQVPRADIRVRELPPNIVRRSDDVVVAGREPSTAFSLPFDGDLQVTLGDDVHVFALGLDADVGGNLRVRFSADRAPRLDGRIFLAEGRYAAYGQKLKIERGNLFYAGPIDNPTLDIRAVRSIDDAGTEITAGVTVSGPASAPEIAIFTDPTTSQTDALSYLLLGRAATDTSGAEGEALSQAALAIGMSRSSPLTTRIASELGLDELSVAGDNVDTAELVAGKQINDRLYIRYRYGVFSNLGAILLRYRLSRRLALEAGSSDVQSIDILYTIEK